MWSREHFHQLALAATDGAPEYLWQSVRYPLPIVGSLRCTLLGFERDSDGIRPMAVCTYQLQFSCDGNIAVEANHISEHKCRNLFYKQQPLRPPWRMRTAACVALAYECLPSRNAALNFLRCSDGPIPGGAAAKKVVLIGAPKTATELPCCITDPMRMESCLLVLAELDT